ncbi:putative chloroplast-targeted copper chaperone [Tripterygium wilfordii]|uniref:Putative chloroplast-targeted copper chaperone n=1 Tax=Tripterygium wilfordii TaxID=458696 RepID=A0A7J7DME5_TRIWF|nr:protein SODIUM POTASSIUM ROOT DEFECTIVE 1-like [Tripterygium wilfordii]KAF5747542.1 putative chloroplast-targeted copper chaperone [Tripterygium wilfordii]
MSSYKNKSRTGNLLWSFFSPSLSRLSVSHKPRFLETLVLVPLPLKGIADMLCTSQASTAICLSMDEASSSSSSSSIQLGGRAIDRHNPIIRDQKRLPRGGDLPAAPCSSSQQHINPKKTSTIRPNNNDRKGKKSSSSNKPKKSSDKSTSGSANPLENHRLAAPLRDSSRYLLSETPFFNGLSDYDPVLTIVPAEAEPSKITSNSTQALTMANDQVSSKPSSSSTSSDQVVVLRVSLHCRGCEGKLRKHLSRMKGVTSFNIDYAAKKVTIIGDISPVTALASVSKVKSAQFWTSSIAQSCASAKI